MSFAAAGGSLRSDTSGALSGCVMVPLFSEGGREESFCAGEGVFRFLQFVGTEQGKKGPLLTGIAGREACTPQQQMKISADGTWTPSLRLIFGETGIAGREACTPQQQMEISTDGTCTPPF